MQKSLFPKSIFFLHLPLYHQNQLPMRTLLLFFSVCCFLACNNEPTTTNQTENITENTATAAASPTLEKKDACQYLERGTMAKILGWNPVGVNESLVKAINNGQETVCSYAHQEEVLQLRVLWEESAPEDYVLIKRYGAYLEQGEGDISYRVTKADANSQTIFGVGKTPEKLHQYIMRKRIGNTLDIELSLASKKNAAAEFRTRLLQLTDVIDL